MGEVFNEKLSTSYLEEVFKLFNIWHGRNINRNFSTSFMEEAFRENVFNIEYEEVLRENLSILSMEDVFSETIQNWIWKKYLEKIFKLFNIWAWEKYLKKRFPERWIYKNIKIIEVSIKNHFCLKNPQNLGLK